VLFIILAISNKCFVLDENTIFYAKDPKDYNQLNELTTKL
jgi:hypothetical protein